MDRKSWIALLEVLEADPALRADVEAAAQRGQDQLVSAFQALGPRVGETPSSADVAALLGAAARARRTSTAEIADKDLERVSGGTSDDAQLANVDLQNVLQKQQQTLQMMSNISKMMSDTAFATVRKIGG